MLLVTARTGTVDSPAVAAEGKALTAQLAADAGTDGVASYWSLGDVAPLRSARRSPGVDLRPSHRQ